MGTHFVYDVRSEEGETGGKGLVTRHISEDQEVDESIWTLTVHTGMV